MRHLAALLVILGSVLGTMLTAAAPAAHAATAAPAVTAAPAATLQTAAQMAWGGSSAGNAALNWAEGHATGHWYCWGGNGPSCWDCSGLVVAAFAHRGITLPRVSYSMPSSPRLHYIPWQQAQRGDILVWGSPRSPSHVGFKTAWAWTSFEARKSGLRIGWFSYYYFRPSAAYRVW